MSSKATIKWLLPHLLLLALLIGACNKKQPQNNKIPSLKETYTSSDKNPFGGYVAHQLLGSISGYNTTEDNKLSFTNYYNKKFLKQIGVPSTYVIVSNQFFPSDVDIASIADYVSSGNTLLVAANLYSDNFNNKFNLQQQHNYRYLKYNFELEQAKLLMTDSVLFKPHQFSFYYFPFVGSVVRDSNFNSQTIIKAADGSSNAIVLKYGTGRIIILANATSLSNYFLLTKNNYQYLQAIAAYLPPAPNTITWDNYYHKKTSNGNGGNNSSFSELLKHPPLKWAFWLVLLGALLLMLTGLVRSQRKIPIIKPNTNSSVDFSNTIARLYLNKKENKNIAHKMINHFMEKVKAKYYINSNMLNQDFAETLAAKTGVTIAKTQVLINTINQIQQQQNIDDYMLLNLNEQLNQFKI
jgi:hypothetical protein